MILNYYNRQKRDILLVSVYANPTMRATSREHLFSFRNYSGDNIFYLNLAHKGVPRYVAETDFDLIIFHTFFLTKHWAGRSQFRELMERTSALKKNRAVKAMLPQDEFINSDLLAEFISEFGINHVFSVAPPATWQAIYHNVDFEKVKFHTVLTGYLDEKRLPEITALGETNPKRPIDIGYRTAGKPVFWFGRHGYLKQRIADICQEKATQKGLTVDISTRSVDTIPGNAWYKFLASCKYTLGVESGTSLIDPDGAIRARTEAYLAANPEAPFSEVENACFPGLDERVCLYAISPRHLEACATRTCQILTKGEYNGILEADVHYLALKRDFSNIDDVLNRVVRGDLREMMVERAYNDVVRSGRYTYSHFVRVIIETCLEDGRQKGASSNRAREGNAVVYYRMNYVEILERWTMKILYPLKALMARWRIVGAVAIEKKR